MLGGTVCYLGSSQIFDASVIFGGCSEAVRDSLLDFLSLTISAESIEFFFCPIFSPVCALVSRLLISPALVWKVSSRFFSTKNVPCFSGLRNPWIDSSALASAVLGILLPSFLYHHSVTTNFSCDLFPDL